MSTTRLPHFIIGGAPRSGTTFLAAALDKHPDVFVAKPFIPEPKVFMGPPRKPSDYLAHYGQLFEPALPDQRCGEKTSYYLESEFACEMIRTLLPEVKLLFIVREPVARAYSNYLWSRKNGLETLSFSEAIQLEGKRPNPLPPEKEYARPFDYLSRSRYDLLATRYFNALGRDRVKFVLYEEIDRDLERLLREVQEFIGVTPLPAAQLDAGIINAARDSGEPLSPELEKQLRDVMRPHVLNFQNLTRLDLSSWTY